MPPYGYETLPTSSPKLESSGPHLQLHSNERRPRILTVAFCTLLCLVCTAIISVSLGLQRGYTSTGSAVWHSMGTPQLELPPFAAAPPVIRPFYLQGRKSAQVELHDTTVFTMATIDRLEMVRILAEQYQGAYQHERTQSAAKVQ